jgi:thioesterase domain-containing protein
MSSDLQAIERYLHDHIPISRAMSIRVLALDAAGVRLGAPLAPNINHRSTVFGGSASAVAILAAWTLVHFRLREAGLDGRVVIQRNAVEYLSPIDDDFEAFCPAPPTRDWQRFTDSVARRGRGRLHLTAELRIGAERVGHFEGMYVAFGRGPSQVQGVASPDPSAK